MNYSGPGGTEPVLALSALTTLRVGGLPESMIAPASEDELIEAMRDVWDAGENWLLLGGGSNTVAADNGFDGTVVRLVTKGVERLSAPQLAGGAPTVRLRVQAGESWDDLVAYTVEQGWTGIEALSGIPGCCGAAPVQNIGAYGQELSSSLVAVTFLDFETHEVSRLLAPDLALGYRMSALKTGERTGVVLAIELDLVNAGETGRQVLPATSDAAGPDSPAASESVALSEPALGQPIGYDQLATALGVQVGERVPLTQLRRAVLALRASKGMVLDASDADTASAGSFFTNPIVSDSFARLLPAAVPRWPVSPAAAAVEGEVSRVTALADLASRTSELLTGPVPLPAALATPDFRVKLSAAWLIEHAGISRGFALPGSRAAISGKHTLALTNRGGATADDIVQLARFVQGRVQAEFGVILQPEPVLVGLVL